MNLHGVSSDSDEATETDDLGLVDCDKVISEAQCTPSNEDAVSGDVMTTSDTHSVNGIEDVSECKGTANDLSLDNLVDNGICLEVTEMDSSDGNDHRRKEVLYDGNEQATNEIISESVGDNSLKSKEIKRTKGDCLFKSAADNNL